MKHIRLRAMLFLAVLLGLTTTFVHAQAPDPDLFKPKEVYTGEDKLIWEKYYDRIYPAVRIDGPSKEGSGLRISTNTQDLEAYAKWSFRKAGTEEAFQPADTKTTLLDADMEYQVVVTICHTIDITGYTDLTIYTCKLAEDGRVFWYSNGTYTELTYDKDLKGYVYRFVPVQVYPRINKLEIGNVTLPEGGSSPVASAEASADWFQLCDEDGPLGQAVAFIRPQNLSVVMPSDTFEYDQPYRVAVYVRAVEKHLFASSEDLTCTINGRKASVQAIPGLDPRTDLQLSILVKTPAQEVQEPVPEEKPSEREELTTPFTDVPEGAYYRAATVWAYNAKPQITDGNGKDKFMPEQICTRGQVVTFLWRALGEPEPRTTANPFTDVKTGDYFYKPVLWAVEKGITDGTAPDKFSPAAPCKNSHILTFIWRALGEPDKTGEGTWYTDAQNWAEKNGLLKGTYSGAFDINAQCPRKNVVEYLYRYYNMK